MSIETFPLLKLPQDLLLNVFSYLEINELCIIAKTCKLIKELSENDVLWAPHCQTFFSKMHQKKSWKANCISWMKNWKSYPKKKLLKNEYRFAFARDNDKYAALTTEQEIRLYHDPNHGELFIPKEKGKFKTALSIDNGRLAVGYESGEIAIWDIKEKQPIMKVNYQNKLRKILLKGTCISSLGEDNRFKIWDSSSGQLLLESEKRPLIPFFPISLNVMHLHATADHVIAVISRIAWIWSINERTYQKITKEKDIICVALEKEWLVLGTEAFVEIHHLFQQKLLHTIPINEEQFCAAIYQNRLALSLDKNAVIWIVNCLDGKKLKELNNPTAYPTYDDKNGKGRIFELIERMEFAPSSLILYGKRKLQIINFFTNKQFRVLDFDNKPLFVKNNVVFCSGWVDCLYDFSIHGPHMSFLLRTAEKIRSVVWRIFRAISNQINEHINLVIPLFIFAALLTMDYYITARERELGDGLFYYEV